MKKTFVLDTNVLIHDPHASTAFDEHDVVIPIQVVEELDGLKGNPAVGYNAREASRQLVSLFAKHNAKDGAPTEKGGRIFLDLNGDDPLTLPHGLNKSPDNMILLVARRLTQNHNDGSVILVSKDTNLRLKAKTMELETEDYESDKTGPVDQLYSGLKVLPVPENVIHTLGKNKRFLLDDDSSLKRIAGTLMPNICCKLVPERLDNETLSALAIYKKDTNELVWVDKPKKRESSEGKNGKIYPRNMYQCFAYELVMDLDISLVTLSGVAGSGKSLIALLAAYRLLEKGHFERIIVIRPTKEVGDPMGYLPGAVEEKFAPWIRPVAENLGLVCERGKIPFDEAFGKKVEVMPINFVRGVTFNHALMIVDESQNLAPLDVKTAITRAGEGTKVVVNGDPTQVDGHFLDPQSNGLVHVIARCPGQISYGHIRLDKSVRSLLAEVAATIL